MEDHGSAHPQYVAEGGCPATMPGSPKTWCNARASHAGQHYATRIFEDGKTERIYWSGRTIQDRTIASR